MKKIISILLLYTVFSVGQTMPHWNTQGNTVVNGQYFGSKNAKDVIFKANNTTLFNLKSNGKINFPTLSNTTGQFLTTNDIGDVELKDIATWLGSGNVGINTITPTRTLVVNGLMKIGNIAFTDPKSNIIIGNSSQSAVRTSLCGDGNYQDFQFVKTNAAANSINSWGFGQRFDTFFGNQSGSFQFIGSYTNNSGAVLAAGGGYRVPIICNPDGSIIIAGASANAINGNVGVGTVTPNQKLDVTGTVQATQFKLSALNTAPASSTATGSVGEIRIVNGFIYVCVAANTWQRATLNSF